MSEQRHQSTQQGNNEPPSSPYGYNERNIHSETTELGEFTDTLNSDRVKLESSFFNVKHRWLTGTGGKTDARRTTTDINNFGISIITLTSDNEVLIYHDGRIYKPVNQYWIDNLADDLKSGTLPAYLPNALALTDFSTHPLGNYIIDHWRTLGDGQNIITYCRTSQLCKVSEIISRYPFAFKHYRITRQQHITAFGAPNHGDSQLLIYNGMFCQFDYSDHLMEILSSGVIDECGDGLDSLAQCKTKELDNSTAFFQFVSGNPVKDLSLEQIAKIYTGEITNWKDVGGEDAEIVLIGREAGSGTRDGFESITKTKDACQYRQELTSTGDVITTVSQNPNAIGYASLAAIKDSVKALTVNGVAPTEATVKDGTYLVQRPFVLVTKEGTALSETAQKFFDFATSADAASIISAAGAVPVA